MVPFATVGTVRRIVLAVLACLSLVVATSLIQAQGKGKKSDSVVKTTAEASKPDAEGKQLVTVNLAIDKPWHVYANPVGNQDLFDAATVVTVKGATPLKDVKIEYPAGKLRKEKTLGDYNIYEDRVVIKAHIQRATGDTGPLEVSVKLQACNDSSCLLGATVKLEVK